MELAPPADSSVWNIRECEITKPSCEMLAGMIEGKVQAILVTKTKQSGRFFERGKTVTVSVMGIFAGLFPGLNTNTPVLGTVSQGFVARRGYLSLASCVRATIVREDAEIVTLESFNLHISVSFVL